MWARRPRRTATQGYRSVLQLGCRKCNQSLSSFRNLHRLGAALQFCYVLAGRVLRWLASNMRAGTGQWGVSDMAAVNMGCCGQKGAQQGWEFTPHRGLAGFVGSTEKLQLQEGKGLANPHRNRCSHPFSHATAPRLQLIYTPPFAQQREEATNTVLCAGPAGVLWQAPPPRSGRARCAALTVRPLAWCSRTPQWG